MSNHLSEVNESNFELDVLQSVNPVLVNFWPEWCAPCAVLAPVIELVAEQYAGRARVVKLNVDQNQAISQLYGIKGIPTLILFSEGVEQGRVAGLTSEETISWMIERRTKTSGLVKDK